MFSDVEPVLIPLYESLVVDYHSLAAPGWALTETAASANVSASIGMRVKHPGNHGERTWCILSDAMVAVETQASGGG